MGDVVAQRLEMRVAKQRREVVLAAGEVVVDAQDVVALGEEPLAQMRAQKPPPAGDENALADDTHGRALTPGPATAAARGMPGGRCSDRRDRRPPSPGAGRCCAARSPQ